jgi:hypothetical protein
MFLYLLQYLGAIAVRQRIVKCYNLWVFMELGKKITGGFESFYLIFRVKGKIMLEHRSVPNVIFDNKDLKRMVFHAALT